MDEKGERVSREALVEHAAFVRNVARGLLRDEHRAEDVAQATMLAAIEKPPPSSRNLRAWLARVTRNLALRHRRTEARRTRRERQRARPGETGTTAEAVARLELQRLVVTAVLDLDEIYRTVVIHRYLDGLSRKEIAARLDIPEQTVKTRLKRALQTLRARLDTAHDGNREAWTAPLLALLLPHRKAAAVTSALLAKCALVTALAGTALILIFVERHSSYRHTKPPVRATVLSEKTDGFRAARQSAPAPQSRSSVAPQKPSKRPGSGLPIAGRVTGPDGTPLRGARIWVQNDSKVVRTDADGRYELTGPASGSFSVDCGGVFGGSACYGKYVEAGSGEVDFEISGYGRLALEVFDERGRPFRQATVDVSHNGWIKRLFTDERGRIEEIVVGNPRPLVLSISAPGYVTVDRVLPDATADYDLQVNLDPFSCPGALEIRATDAKGRPVRSVFVTVSTRAGIAMKAFKDRAVALDAEGHGRLSGLPPGHYGICISTTKSVPAFDGYGLYVRRTVEIAASETSTETVRIPDGGRLKVIVRDRAGKMVALGGAELLQSVEPEIHTGIPMRSPGNGDWKTGTLLSAAAIPPGDYCLRLIRNGKPLAPRPITITAHHTTTAIYRLPPD